MSPEFEPSAGHRRSLAALAHAIRLESDLLSREPSLFRQQVTNRLAWDPEPAARALAARTGADDGEFWLAGRLRPAEPDGLRRVLGGFDQVDCCAISPDGTLVLAGGRDGNAVLFDMGTGRRRAELPGHGRMISSGAFHPGGETIYLLDRGGRLDRWRFDGRRAHHGTGASAGATGRTVSAANHLVLVTGDEVRLCDGQTLEPVRVLTGGPAATCGAVTPDGSLIVAGYSDGTLRAWSDGGTGRSDRTVQLCPNRHVSGCAVDRTGRRILASTADGRLHLLDSELRPIRRLADQGRPAPSAVWACAGSADLDRVVSALSGGVIQLWDGRTGTRIGTVSAHAGDVTAVAVSPDGSRVVSAGQDGRLHVWDGEQVGDAGPEPFRQLLQHLWLTPDDGAVLAVDAYGIARRWDTGTGELSAESVTCEGFCAAATSTPDGRTLLVVDRGAGLQVRPLGPPDQRSLSLTHPGATIGAFVGGVIVSAGKDDGTVIGWDLASGDRRWQLDGQRGITTMAPDPGRGLVVLGHTSGAVALLDAATGALSVLRPGGDTEITACVVTGRGLFAAGTAGGQVLAWDEDRTSITMPAAAHEGRVRHLAAGTRNFPILSAGQDGAIIRWPVRGAPTRLSGHGDDVRHVAVGDHGRLVVSTSNDRTTRVWSLDDGRQLALLPLPSRGQLVAAHPAQALFACSDDGGFTTAFELRGRR